MKNRYITPETSIVEFTEAVSFMAGSEDTPVLPVKDEDEDAGNDGGSNLAKPNRSWEEVGYPEYNGSSLWE